MNPTLSVIVPVYNEVPTNLSRLVSAVTDVLRPLAISYEILFVDDGSNEATNSALRQLLAESTFIRLLILSRNFGEQAAITAGLNYAKGDAVVNMDSDLQDPPAFIPQMIAFWQEGYDIVYTRQVERQEHWLKVFPAKMFYRVLNFCSDIHIPMDVGEFRLMSRRAVDSINSLPEKSRFLRGMIPWIGFKQKEIPFVRQAREAGTSSYSLGKLFELALQGLLSFSTMPLRIISVFGLLMILGSAVCICLCLPTNHVTNEMNLAGCALMSGLQIFFLGVIAMYITQLLTETRSRPVFIVSELIERSGFDIGGCTVTGVDLVIHDG